MDVTSQHRKEIEEKIMEAIITALENNRLKQDELPLIASYVLERIDKINNHEELIVFLRDLSDKWAIFDNLEEIEKGEVKEENDEDVVEGMLQLAKSGKID